jgi:hypothetical protein
MMYPYMYTLNKPNDVQYPNMSDFPMCHHLHIAGLAVNHVCAGHYGQVAVLPVWYRRLLYFALTSNKYLSQAANQTLLLNKGPGGNIFCWSNRRRRFLEKINVSRRLRAS